MLDEQQRNLNVLLGKNIFKFMGASCGYEAGSGEGRQDQYLSSSPDRLANFYIARRNSVGQVVVRKCIASRFDANQFVLCSDPPVRYLNITLENLLGPAPPGPGKGEKEQYGVLWYC